MTLYGISNCDTVKKARRWLDARGIDYRFHDLRRDGLDAGLLADWVGQRGWETLINRRGTTWRRVPEAARDRLDRATATRLMLEQPAVIRRPLLVRDGQLYVGFDADRYRTLFDASAPP